MVYELRNCEARRTESENLKISRFRRRGRPVFIMLGVLITALTFALIKNAGRLRADGGTGGEPVRFTRDMEEGVSAYLDVTYVNPISLEKGKTSSVYCYAADKSNETFFILLKKTDDEQVRNWILQNGLNGGNEESVRIFGSSKKTPDDAIVNTIKILESFKDSGYETDIHTKSEFIKQFGSSVFEADISDTSVYG